MNILIVDDQPDVVMGIRSGIKWKALPIEDVYYAYSMKEAQMRLEEKEIHIVLCDIEMPMGSGLELFAWIQERYSGIKCIFLTSHANFEYAQRALQLGSFDYLLWPVTYEKITASILRAAMQIERERKKENEIAYGQYVSEYEETLANTILREYLNGQENALEKMLRYFGLSMPFLEECSRCLLVHFHVYKRDAVGQKLEKNLQHFIFRNVLQELADAREFKVIVCPLEWDYYTVLFLGQELDIEGARECMEEFISFMKEGMHIHIFACMAGASALKDAPQEQKKCAAYMRECINRYDGVTDCALHEQQEDNSCANTPDFFQCGIKLMGGRYEEVEKLLISYMERLAAGRYLNRKTMCLFQQDLLQMFFGILQNKSVGTNVTLHQNYDPELLQQSIYSTNEMCRLIRFCISYLEELDEKSSNASPVKKACTYIQKHIHENITREDIAKEIYMNVDYLSRIFKKEMGISLKDYIVSEKMKLAVAMLSNTDFSVSMIAANLGFTNFSYFAQVFKKFYNMSPSEYRDTKRR